MSFSFSQPGHSEAWELLSRTYYIVPEKNYLIQDI
jgi:hypothetical protein